MAVDPKTHALQLIDQFRARGAQVTNDNGCTKGNIWLNLCRNKVADGLKSRVSLPWGINQMNTNVCGVAAFVRDWIKDDPVGYAWLGISLYEQGCGYLGRGKYHGKDIRPSKALRNSRVPHASPDNGGTEMNHADWIVMASIREALNDVFNYTADEGPFAIKAWNFPQDVVNSFKAAGYTFIINDTDPTKTMPWSNLQQASNLFEDKWRVILLINARMLDDNTINTQAVFDTSDHWVGLQSAMNLTLVGSEYRVSKFRVFTWSKDRTVPLAESLASVPLNALLKNYYGYVAAKY
jgi:hypothetical protein